VKERPGAFSQKKTDMSHPTPRRSYFAGWAGAKGERKHRKQYISQKKEGGGGEKEFRIAGK